MARFGIRTERGVSLLEVVGIVAALTSLVIGLTYKTADAFIKGQTLDSNAMLRMADNQLRQYIVANGRLPCPALNGDGIAAATCDQTQQKGYLPYITLGMADNNYGFGEVPMLYGAYNDSTIALTSSAHTFSTTHEDINGDPVTVRTTTRNIFDFCSSLAELDAVTNTTTGLSVTQSGDVYKAAYALALPGQGDRDGLPAGWSGGPAVSAQYDGLNALSATAFESPQAPVTPSYDDRTHFRTAIDLHDYFRCEAMNTSVSLLAEAVTTQKQTEAFAVANVESVRTGLILNSIGLALAAWQLAQAVYEVASGAEVTITSSALLSVASGLCPIPPFVACALIPVYAVATSLAGVAAVLAVAAGVSAAVGLGLQLTATVLYADLQGRTSTPSPSVPANVSNISAAKVAQLKTAYGASNATALSAYAALPSPPPDAAARDTAQQTKATTVTKLISDVTDPTLKGLLSVRLTGSIGTCTASTTAACTTAGFVLRGTDDVVANYKKDLLASTAYTPGVVPSLDVYYAAIVQSGASTPISTSNVGSNSTLNTALNNANQALAAVPVIAPVDAMNNSNSVVSNYSNLLTAIDDFDIKNIIMNANNNATTQAARASSLATLRTLIGNSTWDYTGTASLCAGSFTYTGTCGWMSNASANAGTASTSASTASSAVNDYLNAYSSFKSVALYQKQKEAVDTKVGLAWSDRNGYKSGLCALQTPSVSWLGGAASSSNNPANWDSNENLLVDPPTNLSCTGSATPANTSSQTSAARAAEQAKYCNTTSPDHNADLCSLYSASTPARSTIQNAENIFQVLIQKGIAQ